MTIQINKSKRRSGFTKNDDGTFTLLTDAGLKFLYFTQNKLDENKSPALKPKLALKPTLLEGMVKMRKREAFKQPAGTAANGKGLRFPKKYDLYIGIDAGKDTGWAVWSAKEKRFFELETLDFWKTIESLWHYQTSMAKLSFFVRIEDPNLSKAMHWSKYKSAKGFDPKTTIAQKVGMNKKEAELIIKFCELQKIPFERVKPISKKWTTDYFRAVTKYKGKLSQHSVDAGRMVVGY